MSSEWRWVDLFVHFNLDQSAAIELVPFWLLQLLLQWLCWINHFIWRWFDLAQLTFHQRNARSTESTRPNYQPISYTINFNRFSSSFFKIEIISIFIYNWINSPQLPPRMSYTINFNRFNSSFFKLEIYIIYNSINSPWLHHQYLVVWDIGKNQLLKRLKLMVQVLYHHQLIIQNTNYLDIIFNWINTPRLHHQYLIPLNLIALTLIFQNWNDLDIIYNWINSS